MGYGFLADLVVAGHVAYVSYVVFGQLAILLGIVRRWQWVRNPWFRWTHLVMILVVAWEALAGITCPLTNWEEKLRSLSGQPITGDSFVGRLLHNLIFLDLPPWFINGLHVGFAVLVLATFLVAPPRPMRGLRFRRG